MGRGRQQDGVLRAGLEEHWLAEQGVGAACAKGLGRPKFWAIHPLFLVASDSSLSGHPSSSPCLLGRLTSFPAFSAVRVQPWTWLRIIGVSTQDTSLK